MVQVGHFHYCWLYYKQSEALLLRAKNIRMALFGRVHKYVIEVNAHLVILYQDWDNNVEACRILNEELGADMIPWEQLSESEEMRVVICNNWRIRVNAKNKTAIFNKEIPTMKECVDESLSCLKFYEDNFGAGHPYLVSLKLSLGELYSKIPNHLQQSLRQYQQTKKIFDNLNIPHILSPLVSVVLAGSYKVASRTQEARKTLADALIEARRMLPKGEGITFHSFAVVLIEISIPLIGGVNQSGPSWENVITEALTKFDTWRGNC